MEDHDEAARSRQEMVSFLTTEHFTLQTERASASSDTNARLLQYLTVLTSSIISLALVAQLSGIGDAFRGFAMALLPTVYVFGLLTMGRMRQLWVAWFTATLGMSRIRRYFAEAVPESASYVVMPATDDPWSTLRGTGVARGSKPNMVEGMYTAPAAVEIVNSAVVAAFVGILVATSVGSDALPPLLGGVAFVSSFLAVRLLAERWFGKVMSRFEAWPQQPPT